MPFYADPNRFPTSVWQADPTQGQYDFISVNIIVIQTHLLMNNFPPWVTLDITMLSVFLSFNIHYRLAPRAVHPTNTSYCPTYRDIPTIPKRYLSGYLSATHIRNQHLLHWCCPSFN